MGFNLFVRVFLNITHQSPALLGETVIIQSKISELQDRTINCTFEVRVKDRVIATGSQGQKILLKSKIEQLKAEKDDNKDIESINVESSDTKSIKSKSL